MLRGGYTAHTDLESLQTWLDRSLTMIQGTAPGATLCELEQKLNRLSSKEFAALSTYEIARQSTSLYILQQLKTLVEAEAPTIQHLPSAIRDRLLHDSGIFHYAFFPKGNVWDREPLERFIKDLESVDPR